MKFRVFAFNKITKEPIHIDELATDNIFVADGPREAERLAEIAVDFSHIKNADQIEFEAVLIQEQNKEI
jgi:hypothetical protein